MMILYYITILLYKNKLVSLKTKKREKAKKVLRFFWVSPFLLPFISSITNLSFICSCDKTSNVSYVKESRNFAVKNKNIVKDNLVKLTLSG